MVHIPLAAEDWWSPQMESVDDLAARDEPRMLAELA